MDAVLLRAGPWRVQLGLVTAGALLGVLGLQLDGATGTRTAQLGCLLAGVAASFTLDEPAADVVDACPVSLRHRTAVRLPALVVLLAVTAAAWAALGAGRLLCVQLAGTTLVGAAVASVVRRRAHEPGELVAPGLLLSGLALMLVGQLGQRVPLFALDPSARADHLWLGVTLGAALVMGLGTRAPRW